VAFVINVSMFELEVFSPEVFVKQKGGECPSNTTVVILNI